MKRAFVAAAGLALVVAVAAGLAVGAPKSAAACSGPGTHWQMALSGGVFAGRIVAVEENPAASDSIYRHFDLVIQVDTGLRGLGTDHRVAAWARVPRPGIPVMCPQFERDETFLGKYVVAGLNTETDPPELFRWGTAYLGFDPDSSEYAEALRVARMATGRTSSGPTLTATPDSGWCGGTVVVAGRGFSPQQRLLLNYPIDPGPSGQFVRPEATTNASGSFAVKVTLPRDWCPVETFVEAYSVDSEGQSGGYPLAMAKLSAHPRAIPGPPDAGNSPSEGQPAPLGWAYAGVLISAITVMGFAVLRHLR